MSLFRRFDEKLICDTAKKTPFESDADKKRAVKNVSSLQLPSDDVLFGLCFSFTASDIYLYLFDNFAEEEFLLFGCVEDNHGFYLIERSALCDE